MKLKLDRRDFFASLGLSSIALQSLGRKALAAQTGELPKRFIFMFSPNGVNRPTWTPSGSGKTFGLSETLAPLENIKSDIVIVDGLKMQVSGPGEVHQQGMSFLLTGQEMIPLPSSQVGTWADGISIDQMIARQIGANSSFPSLELGVMSLNHDNYSRINYRGSNEPMAVENDPTRVFRTLFGTAAAQVSGVDPAAAALQRRSLLRFSRRDVDRLKGSLGRNEQQKLDSHVDAIIELEKRVQSVAGSLCSAPSEPQAVELTEMSNLPDVAKLQMDLLVRALACDLTRVGTVVFTNAAANHSFPWLNINEGFHDISHRDNELTHTWMTQINRWYAEQFVYLVQSLKAIPEGDGTMLDNSVVVWGTDVGVGLDHDRSNMPFVLAGRCGGKIETGRYLKFNGQSHNDLWVAIARAFGINIDTFGKYCGGALPGVIS